MSKHTPGPWAMESCQVWAFNMPVAKALHCVDRETRQANARLIAAAPDLLEATKALLNCLTYSGSIGLESSQQRQKARNMARAAIAKATQEDKS